MTLPLDAEVAATAACGAASKSPSIRIGLIMYLGEDDGTQNVPIWEHEPFGGPE